MKKFIALLCLAVSGCSCEQDFAKNLQNPTAYNQINQTLIIFYDAQIGSKPLFQMIEAYHAELLYHYQTLHGVAVRLPNGVDPKDAKKKFEQVEGVLGVDYDQVVQLH